MTYRSRSNSPRTITAKFAGKCGCCGGDIPAGRMVTYRPGKGIYHLENPHTGDSAECYGVLRQQHEKRDAGFVDLDRMFEDQCADICGR